MTRLQGSRGAFPLSARVALAVAAASLAGCSGGPAQAPGSDTVEESVQAQSIFRTPLCCGTRETVVDGITSAENVLFSADDRLFASGDDGVYELRRDPGGKTTAIAVTPSASCKFGGMAQIGRTLYANCYDFTNSYLYAGDLGPAVHLAPVYEMAGVLLANGLTADSAGRLYVGATVQGRIIRLHLSPANPLAVASQEDWLANTGLSTDGMKFFASGIYWSNGGAIDRASVRPDGSAGLTVPLVNQVTFLDDFYVDATGILAADYLAGQIKAFNLVGIQVDATPVLFDNPSAVVPAKGRLGFGARDLVVTEKGANRVAVYHPG